MKMTASEWSSTPRDYRLVKDDGTRWVLKMVDGVTALVQVEVVR